MSFYMWLFAVKKLATIFSKAIEQYKGLQDEEKFQLYQEFCKYEEKNGYLVK